MYSSIEVSRVLVRMYVLHTDADVVSSNDLKKLGGDLLFCTTFIQRSLRKVVL